MANDFIERIRERDRAEEERRAAARRVSVLVTRDGSTAQEIIFQRPPTLAELVARVGEDAYVLGVDISDGAPLAAE